MQGLVASSVEAMHFMQKLLAAVICDEYTILLSPVDRIGDQIISVNGQPVLGQSYAQVIQLIQTRSVNDSTVFKKYAPK